ncbi:E3 ubiquitin-protein ligase RNF14-like isoform X2 [Pomacea canaliculata]|uniref:E3 ubiquitin-protein ligase RNF14-like isoform X2 n=1 Tax=Pomacea canaliculata TaxID=400727 RepID=UPI000D727D49|nr:E3 ubiquitin-protein ligase RNF14-like isoform X2 [Pomacea canaliculata]
MAHTENDGISLAIYEGNFVEQKDEIIALQSIFEGDIEERICVLSEPDSCGSGQYVIQAKVPFEMNVKECQVDIWIPTGDTPSIDEQGASAADGPPQLGQGISLERTLSGQKWSGSFKVQFLPPLTLDLTFPSDYPSHSPPSFTVSSIWLSGNQLSLLCKHLDRLWEDNRGIPIVFTWVDWLEKETLHFLGIEDSIVLMPAESSDDDVEDKRVVIDCFDLGEAVHTMLQYSNHKAAVRFFQSMQECGLCFEEKLGSQFFRLTPCFHHFCSDCLAMHCNMHVTEGTISLLKCPASKCETVIPPDVLQTVLSPKLYIRWETLSVQKTLDEMNDITYCPRCKSIVISEAELSLHLGFCLSCFYSFCTQCERAWHQCSEVSGSTSSRSFQPSF